MMVRLACFVSQISKCKNLMILFGEVAASLPDYSTYSFRGFKGSKHHITLRSTHIRLPALQFSLQKKKKKKFSH